MGKWMVKELTFLIMVISIMKENGKKIGDMGKVQSIMIMVIRDMKVD